MKIRAKIITTHSRNKTDTKSVERKKSSNLAN